MFITIYGMNWMKVVERDMTRNRSRDDLDLTAENMCPVKKLLIPETRFLHSVSSELKSGAVKFRVYYC